jgi:aryl-alcohol dehydrogenase-like predicted oxidoreductase
MRQFRRVDTLQPPYSLFRRDIERDVLPYCLEQGIGVLVYGPLAHGLLSVRMTVDQRFAPGDWRGSSPMFQGDAFTANLAVVERLGEFAKRRGHPAAHLAIAWTLSNPAVHVAIVGARNAEQIAGTVPATDLDLSQADLLEIETIMKGAVPIGGPAPEAMPSGTPA